MGLLAYRYLLEVSKIRQLSPAPESDVERLRNPPERGGFGQLYRARAKVLMNQKATSVADIAWVLSLQADGLIRTHIREDETLENYQEQEWFQRLSRRKKLRYEKLMAAKMAHNQKIRERVRMGRDRRAGEVRLNCRTRDRLSEEYPLTTTESRGMQIQTMNDFNHMLQMQEQEFKVPESAEESRHIKAIEQESAELQKEAEQGNADSVPEIAKLDSSPRRAPQSATAEEDGLKPAAVQVNEIDEVLILWQDIKDADYAGGKWPGQVSHGELTRGKADITRGPRGLATSQHVIGVQKEIAAAWKELATPQRADMESPEPSTESVKQLEVEDSPELPQHISLKERISNVLSFLRR